MPTGYTSKVLDGCSFKDYALTCARSFGALLHMRDEPLNAEVTTKVPRSTFSRDQVEKLKAKLEDLIALSYNNIVSRAAQYNAEGLARFEERMDALYEQQVLYERMLCTAKGWIPPSPEHQGLKDFMISQLEQSLDFDCLHAKTYYDENPFKELDPEEWFEQEVKNLASSLFYYRRQTEDDYRRWLKNTRWVEDLVKSL